MYRKIIGAVLVAAFTTVAANADVVMDATPGNDSGANLTSDGSITNTGGQTFTTGTLTSNELARIEIDGPLSGGSLQGYYLAVYNDVDQDAGTWDPGTLVAVSTGQASMDTGTSANAWDFNLPALSDSTVYCFLFTTDPEGTTTPNPTVRPGMRGNTDPYPGGTVFGGGSPQFGGNFDIAAKIITGTDPLMSIDSFTASETVVTEGDDVTLSWATQNADTLTLNPGSIDVTSITTTVVTVNSTTTYELVATNTGGSITNSLTVTALAPPAEGEILTTFGVLIPGVDDADQAGPIMGQSITINVGANTNDAAIPQMVSLNRVTFQARSGNTPGTGLAYLQVYDDWDVDATGAIVTIGNLVAASTNAVDLAAPALSLMTWGFDLDEIDKATEYHYILATDTTAATVLDTSNITNAVNGFELHATDSYDGGRTWVPNEFNVNAATWDIEFEVVTTEVSAAAPVTVMITGPISSGTQMVISWASENGKPYGVQTNSNLIVADWQDWLTGQIGNGSILSVTNTIGPDETFYRVISE